MAKKEFILQGFTLRTHANAVRELFDIPDIQRVILSVAFANENGVKEIEKRLKANARVASAFIGIRNDITSRQGLARLHETGATLFVVDTGSRSVIFHPKLYMVRGRKSAKLVIGSANLTLGGLNNNVEAGILLDLDLTNSGDEKIVNEIEKRFSELPETYPVHVAKVNKLSELDEMMASGRLIDETKPRPPRPVTTASKPKSDVIPRIKLAVSPMFGAKGSTKGKGPPNAGAMGVPLPVSMGGTLTEVWISKPLRRRSLGIPSGSNSNPTGSTTLGKGALDGIDPVTYFRNELFGALKWKKYLNKAGNKSEQAQGTFDLVIKGAFAGTFNLTIRHSLTRVKAAKKDKNLPTEISWNEAIDLVRREDLLDRTMRIFRSDLDPKKFLIDID